MSFVITKKEDKRSLSAFSDKLAFIPNGVNIQTSEFSQSVCYEGTPIGIDSDGLGHIVKTAIVVTAGSATTDVTYTVNKGHNFKVGDYIMASTGAKAYAITAIADNSTDDSYDDITVGTALGVKVAVGDVLYQARAQAASTQSAFKYTPIALVGNSYDVAELENLPVAAVTMGQLISSRTSVPLGSEVKSALKCINVI